MILIRLDSNPHPNPDEYPEDHPQPSTEIINRPDVSIPEEATARVMFPRFGKGDRKRSDFAVEVNWLDVQELVRAFIEMKHPDAVHLERIVKLVRQIGDAGWYNDELPSEEFWEILP